jgi:sulfite reductase (ferredoxin)
MSISDEEQGKPSGTETVKLSSDHLRGEISKELVDGNPFFGKASISLLKHHGTYQQDDRDERSAARAHGKPGGKEFIFMVRTGIPGGKLTSDQLLAELGLCDEVGNGTLRITTRQGLQLHGVAKGNLHRTIRRINEVQLTTIAACGDVERNVMCTPVPYKRDPVHRQLQEMADRLARNLRPKSRAYHEIWLTDTENGERRLVCSGPAIEGDGGPGPNGDEVEPLYGATYLPRKFKTAVGLPGDNSVDLYANDLAFMAICEDYRVVAYNVLVGGSFGMTPSAKKTFPAVAKPLCCVLPEEVIDVAKAIIKVQRDFGNRSDRKVARLKYLIHNWGLEKFKAKVDEYYGRPLAAPRPVHVHGHDDGMGWHEQGDGLWFYGLNVENGRIKDEGDFRLKTALREICTTLRPPLRLTPHQGIIFCDIAPGDRARLEEILRAHGVPLTEDISTVRRWSIACPAMPTCGLAVSESERVMPAIMDKLEKELVRLGLEEEVFTTRMTGCPNGCARPYNCDIGLVGKTLGKYTIYLGGRVLGDRLNFVYKDLVPEDEIVDTLVQVFEYFIEGRQNGETFGDFCHRHGPEALLAACEHEAPVA